MLTAKQIKSLPNGTYPNHMLMKMFPKQQGPGKSSRMVMTEKTDGKGKKVKVPILTSFFQAITGRRRK